MTVPWIVWGQPVFSEFVVTPLALPGELLDVSLSTRRKLAYGELVDAT